MDTIEKIYKLREEAHETWQHCISDKLIYLDESIFSDPTIKAIAPKFHTQIKKRDIWFEVLIYAGEGYVYCVIVDNFMIKAANRNESRDVSVSSNDTPMFVMVTKNFKQPERMRPRVICSSIWLKKFNLVDCLDRYPFKSSRAFQSPTWSVNKDGKLTLVVRSRTTKFSQFPSNIVKGRTQVINDICHNNTNSYRGISRDFKPDDLSSIFNIEIGSSFYKIRIVEGHQNIAKLIQVFLRPLNLCSWPVEWMHML